VIRADVLFRIVRDRILNRPSTRATGSAPHPSLGTETIEQMREAGVVLTAILCQTLGC
jgi:hypothetical protein